MCGGVVLAKCRDSQNFLCKQNINTRHPAQPPATTTVNTRHATAQRTLLRLQTCYDLQHVERMQSARVARKFHELFPCFSHVISGF